MGLFTSKKPLQEIEEDTERLEAEDRKAGYELSVAQKRQAATELRQKGLSPKFFNFDYKRIMQWLREH